MRGGGWLEGSEVDGKPGIPATAEVTDLVSTFQRRVEVSWAGGTGTPGAAEIYNVTE